MAVPRNHFVASRMLIVVSLTAAVACLGFIYTANSVVDAVNEIRFEIRNLNGSCLKARRLSNDPDVLKELPELSAWYSQHCEG